MSTRNSRSKKLKQKTVALRPATHAKLQAVAANRRWKLSGAVDAILDDFIARERIQVAAA